MFDTIGLLLRIAHRYWPIPIVVLLALMLLLWFSAPPRFAPRGSSTNLVLISVTALTLLALVGPFFTASTHAVAFARALTSPLETDASHLSVAHQEISFNAGGRTYPVSLWSPGAAAATSRDAALTCDAALANAPLPSRAPILLYAAGWGGSRTENEPLFAALAEAGYIVIAFNDIVHDAPYASAEDVAAQNAHIGLSSEAKLAEFNLQANRRLVLSVEKARAILDAFSACVVQDANWRANADLESIGFIGFSFGGAIAAELALQDPRIKAVVNVDGALFGQAAAQIGPQPYLMFSSDFDPLDSRHINSARYIEYRTWNDGMQQAIRNAAAPNSTLLLVRGATHEAFTSAYAQRRNARYWPLLSPERTQTIVHTHTLAFLDKSLRGGQASVPDYAEIENATEVSRRFARSASAP